MINCIVAMTKDGKIGNNGNLLFRIPEDIKFFKDMTTNKIVVMGRKTYESIGHPLKDRKNIIISNTLKDDIENIKVIEDIDYIREINNESTEIFIIGGKSIYDHFGDIYDNLYITIYDKDFDHADTEFKFKEFWDNYDFIDIIDSGIYENYKWRIEKWELHKNDRPNNHDLSLLFN